MTQNIGIIDADLLHSKTSFPNLALMKISGYHKSLGHDVTRIDESMVDEYDKVYVSKVFDFTPLDESILNETHVVAGGTGLLKTHDTSLPEYIEHHMPDYSLYRDVTNDRKHKYYHIASIGFTTRHCFRKCGFCVNKKYNRVVKWSDPSEFVDKSRKIITLLDDNILGHPDRISIINSVIDIGKPYEYKQGLDIRLVNEDIAELLGTSKYYNRDYIFAFDDWKDHSMINNKLRLWRNYVDDDGHTKLYMLCGYKSTDRTDIIELFKRIRVAMEYNCLPYIMRYNITKVSPYYGTYVNIARWCNQPFAYKSMSYREFCMAHPEGKSTRKYFDRLCKTDPDIVNTYADMKYGEL
jgi:hypothetical protein